MSEREIMAANPGLLFDLSELHSRRHSQKKSGEVF